MEAVLQELRETVAQLRAAEDGRLGGIADAMDAALADQERATQVILQALASDADTAMGASFEYMMQTGYLFGGWHLGRSALVALQRLRAGSDNPFYEAKIGTALYYAEQILPRCAAHAGAVDTAGGSLQSFPLEWI